MKTEVLRQAVAKLKQGYEFTEAEKEELKTELPSPDTVRNALRRKSFRHFNKDCDSSYKEGWFHRTVAEELQQFYQDCLDGKRPTLILSVPPQHGKSTVVSRNFPAWVLGNAPKTKLIVSSYSADLSTDFSKDAIKMCQSEYFAGVFPEFRLGNTKQSANWGTDAGGRYKATGVDGSLSGHGADIFIIDDPVKNWEEAYSKTYREKVWNWFTSTANTRLSPNSGKLLIMTRWHDEDLAGKLIEKLKETGDPLKVLTFPAIAEKDEKHRKRGEALHPERYDEKFLTSTKKLVGDRTWSSLYQQRPRIEGGAHINREWFNVIKAKDLPDGLQWRRFWDLAVKAKKSNDYTASARVAMDADENLYIWNITRFKRTWPFTKRIIVQTAKVEKVPIGIETVGAFELAVQEVRPLLRGIVKVRSYVPDKDKLVRALPWIDLAERGKVFLVEGAWNEPFMEECERFDPIKDAYHDDQVDAVSGGYVMVKKSKNRPTIH